MRRLFALLSAALLVAAASPSRAAESIGVVFAGRPLDPVPSYRADREVYLDVQRVGEIYGGQVYWSQVSGRVKLTVRGRAMQFAVDSTRATSGGAPIEMTAPLRVRASRAFVPLELLRSDEFERWSGFDARYDAASRTLVLERRATAGPVHAFSYKDRTRVVVELAPGVAYSAAARGVGTVELSIPYGVVEADDSVAVDDGIVAAYAVKQEARRARIVVRLAAAGQRWRVLELADPRRLALDVYAPGAAASAAPPVEPGERAVVPAASAPQAPAASTAAAAASAGAAPAPTVQPAPPPATAVAAPAPAAPSAAKPRRRVVVVDAGHGGKDPGASSARGTDEKNVTLAAALELARVLRQRGDFDVVLTRTDDTFVPLSDRSKKANDLDADLFVSLHCNSARNRRERGFEVYSVSETASDPEAEALAAAENAPLELEGKKPSDENAQQILLAMTKTEMINESAPFAALVERELAKRVGVPDRGHKQAAFYVLRGTHAPAILVEMAFLSHPKDELELNSRTFRRKVVEGVAAGIADYARKKGWLQ
jgi:N-acetylmuramoyl-L-alanine amidase